MSIDTNVIEHPADGRTGEALRTLREMGPAEAPTAPALARARGGDFLTASRAMDIVQRLGAEAVLPLVADLGRADAPGRRHDVAALGLLGPAAVPPLVAALGDRDPPPPGLRGRGAGPHGPAGCGCAA